MFDSLTNRLNDVFDRLRGKGALTEDDVNAALREVRVALLEADVALPVVKDFVAAVRERATGQNVVRSVTPGQMVVKIVHDHLVEVLGGNDVPTEFTLNAAPPVPVLMVGLQGSGKTTSTAKIALRLTQRDRKKVLMASLDVARPAAQEQLAILGRQVGVETLPIVKGEPPVTIARRAMDTGRREGYDVVMLDTAGRLHIDEALMLEVAAVRGHGEAARDAAGGRQHDRPGRGQRRAQLQRTGRRHRYHADPRRRRCPRGCRTLHARDHRQAHQAAGRRREDRPAGGLPSRSRGRPHPGHGRRRQPGREGGGDGRPPGS